MKKLYTILIGILLIGVVVSFTQISDSITFEKTSKDSLTSIGISNPVISSCLKIDDYKCKANIYEKGGINKEIEITTKFCEEYEIEFYDGECLNYLYTEEQGDCLNWTENQTICSEYEIIQVQGNCTTYETLNRTTSECKTWKTLTQEEIENEMKITTENVLKGIVQVEGERNEVKDVLTDEIVIEIKEKVGEIIK